MFHGVLALLTRSLRQDARQLKNHVFRLVFVAFIYLALVQHLLLSRVVGAPGLQFFISIAVLNAVFITCAGIGFFATAIAEEKEEEVIGLLMMAGLNPLGILLGKSTSRLIQASFLLLVQFPFMLLAVTLGGVTPHQILAAYVALLAFMVLLANIALFWSTVCQRGGSAAAMTTVFLVLYAALPKIASAILLLPGLKSVPGAWSGTAVSFLNACEQTCVYWQLEAIMTTGFAGPVMSTQVISNLIGGLISFGLAWLVFDVFNRDSARTSDHRGSVLTATGRRRIFGPGRAWAYPLAWKDYQFISGGPRFIALKFGAYLLLYLLLDYGYSQAGDSWNDAIVMYIICLVWAVVIEASILSARIFHDEVRLQTMSSLLMLPRDLIYIGYSKALGCLLGLVPSVCCLALSTLFLPGLDLKIVLEFLISPVTWGAILMFAVFLHLVALLSLFVKWGALPLGFVMMAPIMTCCPVVQLIYMVSSRQESQEVFGSLVGTAVIWTLMGLVCFVFQMMIAARLQEIGSR